MPGRVDSIREDCVTRAAGPGRYDAACELDQDVVKGWVRERVPELTEPTIAVITQHGLVVGRGQSSRDAAAPFPRAAFAIQLTNACFGAGELRLAVLADGVKCAETGCALALEGALDLLTAESCAGWLSAPAALHRRLEIEIFRNGARVARVPCGGRDAAGRPSGHRTGFMAHFPLAEAREAEPVTLSLRLPGSAVELFGGPFLIGTRAAAVLAGQRAARLLTALDLPEIERAILRRAVQDYITRARIGENPVIPLPLAAPEPEIRLNVIIPVYRGLAATRACIDAVLAHRIAPLDRVILINDASPEPGMAELLEIFLDQPNLFLLTNPDNLGFIKTINRGLAFAAGDVLLLDPGTIVHAGAFDELAAIARSAPDIGTVTALSNDAAILSYPAPHLRRPSLPDCGWAELAEAARAANAGIAVEVPAGHGCCLLITAAALRAAGPFDCDGGEEEFCSRAADLGYRHVAAAGVFVQHGQSRSFSGEREGLMAGNPPRLADSHPEYLPGLTAFERRDGLRAARWALDEWRLARAGTPFILVISNSLPGGAARALRDIEESVGYGAARKLSLTCREDGSVVLTCESPLLAAGFTAEETGPLFRLLDAASPGHVLIHQLLGFGPDFLRRLPGWLAGRHTVFYLHDFHAICPRVTLIDAAGDFCGVAPARTCETCLAIAGPHENARMDGIGAAGHREMFADLLRACTHVIAPSEDAGRHLRSALPDLAVTAIPHPQPGILPPGQTTHRLAREDPPIRHAEDPGEITLFGAIGPHKGADRLLEIARRARLTHPGLSFRVIGYTSRDRELLAEGNVTITGSYAPEMLPVLAAEARGRLALFLHQWPETWSYTLSEALSFGFIPLVPDLGAPAERLRAAGFGVIYPFPATAAAILQHITDTIANRIPGFAPNARPGLLQPGQAALDETRRILKLASARSNRDNTAGAARRRRRV